MPFAKPLTLSSRKSVAAGHTSSQNTLSTSDRILLLVEALGPDVQVTRRGGQYVFRRGRTFGAMRENPRGVSLGLYLPGCLVGDRLLDGSQFRLNRITHLTVLRNPEDLDEKVRNWVRRAFDRS